MAQRHVEAYTGAHSPAWKHRFPPHGSTVLRQQAVAVAALLSRFQKVLQACRLAWMLLAAATCY